MRLLSEWADRFQVALQGGRRCVLCHALSAGQAVCAACAADVAGLRRLPDRHCPLCGVPATGGLPCGACQRRPPPQKMLTASFRYAPPISNLVYAYKFLGQNHLYAPLAELMLAERPRWPEEWRPELVVAMPLSRRRLHQRGFNQSHLLASALAAGLQLPLLPPAAIRRRHRPPQSTLPRGQRRSNVRGVFQVAAAEQVKKRNLLLIDDVVTTGATMAELSETLMRAGAAAVCCWALARPD